MARITRKQLQLKVEYINSISALNLEIEYAYGRPRVFINRNQDLSPRLPAGQLWDWLDAFEKGIEYGVKIGVHGQAS